jgi:hypothetical protein
MSQLLSDLLTLICMNSLGLAGSSCSCGKWGREPKQLLGSQSVVLPNVKSIWFEKCRAVRSIISGMGALIWSELGVLSALTISQPAPLVADPISMEVESLTLPAIAGCG